MKGIGCFKKRGVVCGWLSVVICFWLVLVRPGVVYSQGTTTLPQPQVAIHVSEFTQALATMPASPPTPTGPGTTGYEWWIPNWTYFVGYEVLKEALISDGTPFLVVSDQDISSGALLNQDGSPRFPIVFSLAAEAIGNSQTSALESYVLGGGFLFVGASAFTRNPDGTTRGNFALANQMGFSMANFSLENWYENSSFTKAVNHRLISHIPSGNLIWRAPQQSEEICLGAWPNHGVHNVHYSWGVTAGDSEILAYGDHGPILTVKSFGKGKFIYHGLMQSLLGHGGNDPGMYAYLIYRNAIEWAFESASVPIIKVSPWQYEIDAAYMVRHDFENEVDLIQSIESSAEFEQSVGAKGEYYFCTGTLRENLNGDITTVESLRRAVSTYGALIGSHNGGLPNPRNTSLSPWDYDYWHWGPDEAIGYPSPPGYPNGKAYALSSITTSFQDIEDWLEGIDNGRTNCGSTGTCPRMWVSPYFNSTREDSYDILESVGAITMGEQKTGAFPHRTVSYTVPGKRFEHISLPVSDWFVGNDISHSLELHNSLSMRSGVDFYYNSGFLINFYGHAPSDSGLQQEYVAYVASKPRVWATNSVGIYDWWLSRSNVVMTPAFSKTGSMSFASASISGITHGDTAVEMVIPNWNGGQNYALQIKFNGIEASPSNYRVTNNGIKCRPGLGTSLVEVTYAVNQPPVATNDTYSTGRNTALSVPAPGVLGNDTDPEESPLTAQLVSNVSHGSLTLNANGSFTYTPTTGYTGTDSFTYRAYDGNLVSNNATVTITVNAVNQPPVATNDTYSTGRNTALSVPAPGVLGNDTDPEESPLTAQLVSNVSHGSLTLNANGSFTYTPTTGYTGTDSFTYRAYDGNLVSNNATVTITVNAVNQPPVATNDTYSTGRNTALSVPAPGVLGNDTDPEESPLTAQLVSNVSHGSLTLNANGSFTYTPTTGYTGTDSFTYRAYDGNLVSNNATVTITVNAVNQPPVATNDTYSTGRNTALSVPAPGVLGNDTDPEESPLTAQLVSNVSHGSLTLNANGSFTYTPTTGYTGTDSFTYRAYDGNLVSNNATVTITVNAVNQPPVATNDTYSTGRNTALSVPAPGVLGNDTDPEESPLTAQLVSNVSHGSLTLNANGSFTYTPTTGYTGTDSFTYRAYDGNLVSNNATVTITVNAVTQARVNWPNGGEVVPPGESFQVSWDAPNEAINFKLFYSLDNGKKWKRMKTQSFDGFGTTATWVVPRIKKKNTNCLIKVIGYDSSKKVVGSDTSDNPFSIEALRIVSPQGGDTFISGDDIVITWQTNTAENRVSQVRLFYTTNGKSFWKKVDIIDENLGSYVWKAYIVGQMCKIKIVLKDVNGRTIGEDVSADSFVINPS